MDPLSITVSCVSLVGTITKVSVSINGFVRQVRDARGDLDAVGRELWSLKTVLEILGEEGERNGNGFPENLERQIMGILKNCGGLLEQIERSLEKHSGGGFRNGVKWTLGGKDDMAKLRSNLEAHKSALDIALDMVALSIAREIKTDTTEILSDTAAIKNDTSQILAEIARLQARLPRDGIDSGNRFTLQRYLDNLSSYAESSAAMSDPESDGSISGDEEKRVEEITEPSSDQHTSSRSVEEARNEMMDMHPAQPSISLSQNEIVGSSPVPTKRLGQNVTTQKLMREAISSPPQPETAIAPSDTHGPNDIDDRATSHIAHHMNEAYAGPQNLFQIPPTF